MDGMLVCYRLWKICYKKKTCLFCMVLSVAEPITIECYCII